MRFGAMASPGSLPTSSEADGRVRNTPDQESTMAQVFMTAAAGISMWAGVLYGVSLYIPG